MFTSAEPVAGGDAVPYRPADPEPPRVQTEDCLIIVPCYNEADRLPVARFTSWLEQDPHTVFLFVNDGSSDNTQAVLDDLHAKHPHRFLVHAMPQNSGKAEAVRTGMVEGMNLTLPTGGSPRVVGFWDADLATDLDCIPLLASVFDRLPKVEMVFGARVLMMGHDIQRKTSRHYLGRVFATFASMTLGLPVYDTQCGAKLFKVTDTLREVLAEPFLSRWIFDVEIIARWLQHRRGNDTPQAHETIYEHPLPKWQDVAGSKVKPTDFFKAISELWRIKRRYMRG